MAGGRESVEGGPWVRGPWVQPLLAFNVAFLALLFLVQAWQVSRSSGEEERDGPMSAVWGRVTEGLARGGGPPFLL
jgi:hypothetical protein